MMKYLLATLALTLAAPVAAQTAPAHQGRQQHGQHQPAQHQRHDQHGQHQQGQHNCPCCADRNGNARMDCCEEAQAPSANRQGD
jgi:hypothetical protein